MDLTNVKKLSDYLWEIPKYSYHGMNVPARIYASEKIIHDMDTAVLEQMVNVSKLPGIVDFVYCMPDGHRGYGFPIGGIAAMDLDNGVISPGGIGFDINCGMRLISTNLTYEEVKPRINSLMNQLFSSIKTGIGSKGGIRISELEFKKILENGAKKIVKMGYGCNRDLESTEDSGYLTGADFSTVSKEAFARGFKQLGTLGSGNHFLEVQVAREIDIIDKKIAAHLGIVQPNQIVVMFHCGSRGLGHQVATDYLRIFKKKMYAKYGLKPITQNLFCAPFNSEDGQNYFSAMKCAANMAYANRQVILHKIREAISVVFRKSYQKLGINQIYDCCHNIAKIEKHKTSNGIKEVLVHRKGSTRAFGPNALEIPQKYIDIGIPVILGGSMQTASYLLVGTDTAAETFCSTSHGSGRKMNRFNAKQSFNGRKIAQDMKKNRICIKSKSFKTLAEEAGGAYKDISTIVDVIAKSKLCKPIVRLTPIGSMKG